MVDVRYELADLPYVLRKGSSVDQAKWEPKALRLAVKTVSCFAAMVSERKNFELSGQMTVIA